MNTRGRLILGGLSVVAGVVAVALSFTLPDVGEPAYPHSYNEYANGYAISHLPMAAIALILAGVVMGVLPAGRSPYRLILSGIAVATAPLGGIAVATAPQGVSGAVRPFVSNGDVPSPPLNRIAFVTALAVGLLLIAGAAAIAGLGPVVTVASPVAVLVATAALSASLQHSDEIPLLQSVPIVGLPLIAWAVLLMDHRRGWLRNGVLTVLGLASMYVVNFVTSLFVPSRYAVVPPIPALQPQLGPRDILPAPAPLDYLVIGILIGAVAAGLVVLSRPRFAVAGAQSGQPVESAGVRRLFGGAVVAVAIGFWSYGLVGFEPALRVALDAMLARLRQEPCCSVIVAVPDGLAGRDFRWTAVLLGIGGVLLLVRGSNRRTVAAVLALVGWLTADAVGARLNLSGWLPGAAAAVVVALVVTAAVLVGNRVPPGPQRPVPLRLVYGAVALAAAPMLAFDHGIYTELPPVMEQASEVLAIALVLVGVTVAVTAAPRLSVGRVLFAVVVAGSGAATVWRCFVEVANGYNWSAGFDILVGWFVAVATFAVVAVGLGRPRTWHAWVVASAAALAAPSLASAAVVGSLLTSREAEHVLTPLTGAWARIDGYSMGLVGVLAGLTTALMIVVAGSWWGRRAEPEPAPAAVPPHPADVPASALAS